MSSGSGRQNEAFVRDQLNVARLETDLRSAVDGEVRFDTASRAIYSTDASNYRQVPIGVVIPRSTEAVVVATQICRRYGAPIVPRGAGTGLCGQTCNVAVVFDHSKYLNRVLEIDPVRRIARVQAGTNLDDLRGPAEANFNLTFGPDPATHTHCTFGGMIGNNACGVHSIMSGRTADNVEELEILTYDGLRMRVGATSEQELARIIAEGGRRGEIYRRLRDLRDRHADRIRQRYPKIPRRVSGYNLDDLLPENGFHVARALVGSEGTCVTVLEATVRLVDSPPGRALMVLGYPDAYQAGDHVPRIMEFKPVGVEGFDGRFVRALKKKDMFPEYMPLLPQGEGWLLVEFAGQDRQEARQLALQAAEVLRSGPGAPDIRLYEDPQHERGIWAIREAALGASSHVPGEPMKWEGWEDSAVDPSRIGDYLRDQQKLLDKHGLQTTLYGHYGHGCVHMRISFDFMTESGIRTFNRFCEDAADLVVKYGGSISGEHGDGQSKAIYLPKTYGPELMEAFREFKSIWDPQWKMNPGKVIDPYLPDENLRLGLDYKPWQPKTYFQFPEDDGRFSQATLRCVGVGKCRRTHDAFMCPSYIATREEKHTTRGRARLLFEMFRGDLIKSGWRSREVLDSLDLCLACKGCRIECPVHVDLATYKSEFLAHHYQGRVRPREHYSMGWIGTWAAIGSRVPRLANFASNAPVLGRLTRAAAGISQTRHMPRFAEQTFTAWFRKRQARNSGNQRLLLYPDVFNDVFLPQTLMAATLVLERMGFHVMLPDGRGPDAVALIHYGFLGAARRCLQEAIRRMRPIIADEMPVIFLEPSTAAVFREDMLQLLTEDPEARRLARLSLLLGEFIDRNNLDVPPLPGQAIFHGHCHQKAVLNAQASRNVLRKMGLKIVEPEPGCCGMAGSFGFESRHYDISMRIAEQNLLPAVRDAAVGTYVVAEGFSCRTQIRDGTGREPMHLAELLLAGYQRSG